MNLLFILARKCTKFRDDDSKMKHFLDQKGNQIRRIIYFLGDVVIFNRFVLVCLFFFFLELLLYFIFMLMLLNENRASRTIKTKSINILCLR